MIALCLTDAEIMIAWRILRVMRAIRAITEPAPPSRPCIPPPRPGRGEFSSVVVPADIPMRDIGSARQILSNDAAKTAADTAKPGAP